MDVMMRAGHHQRSGSNLQNTDYDLDTAHTVEVQREVDENGELGSFGFTLNYEKPPIVGTIVPGKGCGCCIYFRAKWQWVLLS